MCSVLPIYINDIKWIHEIKNHQNQKKMFLFTFIVECVWIFKVIYVVIKGYLWYNIDHEPKWHPCVILEPKWYPKPICLPDTNILA